MSSVEAHIELCNSLMAANRMWEETIDTLPDAVYIFGPEKRLSRINRAGETLERATRSFLTGRSCCDMLWGVEGTSCMVDRAVANGAAVKVELPAANKVAFWPVWPILLLTKFIPSILSGGLPG